MTMRKWTIWAHLPGVVLEDATVPWGGGDLCRPSHDQWNAIDPVDWQPTDYADSRPVFFRFEVEDKASGFGVSDKVHEVVRAVCRRSHRALALACGWPLLPDPGISITYFVAENAERNSTYVVGPLGRDGILTGHYRRPRHMLTPEILAHASGVAGQLAVIHDTLPGTTLDSALETLALAGLPDCFEGFTGFRRDLGFLMCVSALEDLLVLPEGSGSRASITSQFATHAAALLSADMDTFTANTAIIRPLYKLRSDLLHGRADAWNSDNEQEETLQLGFLLFQHSLLSLVDLATRRGAVSDLPARLALASTGEAQLAAFRNWVDHT